MIEVNSELIATNLIRLGCMEADSRFVITAQQLAELTRILEDAHSIYFGREQDATI